MSETFTIRLLETDSERFVYYDDNPTRAGNAERVVDSDWSDHDLADLDRVMNMLDMMNFRFEVLGLVQVNDPFDPLGYRWEIDPNLDADAATSPRAIYERALAELENNV